MLLFKKKFLELIASGAKRQTVRVWPKRRLRAGQREFVPGLGRIRITAFEPVRPEALTDEDALLDGFASRGALLAELRRESRELAERQWRPTGDLKHAVVLGALLGIAALGFHSLGDFNLQMPATVWLLGAIAALAGAATRPDPTA